MCDFTQEFKLCSCGGDELPLDRVGWVLQRRNNNKEIIYKKGEPALNFHSDDEKKSQTIIRQKLNSDNCFDFEYSPKEDDFLQIKKPKEDWGWFAFRFKQGKWVEDDSTSFDEWRMQLELLEKGKIKV